MKMTIDFNDGIDDQNTGRPVHWQGGTEVLQLADNFYKIKTVITYERKL